jgi:hypothetical protein
MLSGLEHFSCYRVFRDGRSVAFSLGKTPIRFHATGLHLQENALSSGGCGAGKVRVRMREWGCGGGSADGLDDAAV